MSFLSPHSLAPPLSGQQGSLNLGAEAWVDVPYPRLHRRRHAGLEPSPTPASYRQSQPSHLVLSDPLSCVALRRPSADPAARCLPLAPLTSAPHWAAGRRPRPPSLAHSPGSSCARSGPGSAPAPQWPCSPITLMSAPLPLGFIGSQPALPG